MRAYHLGITRPSPHLPILDRLPHLGLSEPEKSWLACALDGEGTVSIHPRCGHAYKSPTIYISNTNREFLDFFLKLVGGRYHLISNRNTRLSIANRQCFTVEISDSPKVYAVLKAIFPYLIIKKKRAELILRFIEIQDALIRQKKQFKDRVQHTHEQHEIVAEIKLLNRRGKV